MEKEGTVTPALYSIEFTIECQEFFFPIGQEFIVFADEGDGYKTVAINVSTDYNYDAMYRIKFDTYAKRNIRIDLNSGIFGIYVHEEDKIEKINKQSRKKAVIFGDSWTQPFNSYIDIMSELVGLECINNGVGGTGYLADANGELSSYYDRIGYALETLNLNPDVIIFTGGGNDFIYQKTVEATVNEAERCIKRAQALCPNAQIILFGVDDPKEKQYAQPWMVELNEALQDLAFKLNLPFIEMLDGNTFLKDGTQVTFGKTYLTGDGCVDHEKGNGNADKYISSDAMHPTAEGHRYLGRCFAEEVEKVLLNTQVGLNISFDVTVDDFSGTQKSIVNTAKVNEENTNTVTVNVKKEVIRSDEITGTKSAKIEGENSDYVQEGEQITYNIEITNNGELANVANLKDNLPEELEFIPDSLKIGEDNTNYTKEDLEKGIEVKIPSTIAVDESSISEYSPEIAKVEYCGNDQQGSIVPLNPGYLVWANYNDGETVNPVFKSYNSELIFTGRSSYVDNIKRGITGNIVNNKEFKSSYEIEFETSAPKFVVCAVGPCRISADEGEGYKKISSNGNGEENADITSYYRVEFNESKPRNIKLELTEDFYGLFLANGQTVNSIDSSPIPRKEGSKLLFLGDSWSVSNAQVDGSGIGGAYKSYPYIFSDILGLEIIAMGGERTGYVANSNGYNTNYQNLVYALENNYNPDIIVLSGSCYDFTVSSATEEQVGKELEKCLNYIKEKAPNANVIVYGIECPIDVQNMQQGFPTFVSLNETLRKTALDYKVPFIDFLTGETIAGDGTKLSYEKSSYITNSNTGVYINNLFLTEEGHKFIGKEIAKEMAKVLNWYGIEFKGVTASTEKVNVSFKVQLKNTEDIKYEKSIINTAKVNKNDTNKCIVTAKKILEQHLNTINILKTDELGNGLAGANLVLTNSEGSEVDNWLTTDTAHTINDIPDGTYTLKEIKAPDGYDLAENMQILVGDGMQTDFQMQDRLLRATIRLTKVDAWRTEKLLSGAEFQLVKLKDKAGDLVEDESFEPVTYTTGDDGVINFTNLLYGTYRLYETKAPSGYNLQSKYIDVVVNSDTVKDKVVDIQVKNIEQLVLPETGSVGAGLCTLIGMVIISFTLIKIKLRKK